MLPSEMEGVLVEGGHAASAARLASSSSGSRPADMELISERPGARSSSSGGAAAGADVEVLNRPDGQGDVGQILKWIEMKVESSETADAWIEQQILEEASSGAGSADTQRTSPILHQASDVDADNDTSRCGVDEDGAPSTVESRPTGAGRPGGDAGRAASPDTRIAAFHEDNGHDGAAASRGAGLKAEDDPAGAHVESGDASRSVKSGLRPDDALSSALRGQANRRPDESFHEVATGQWRGHSPLSKSVLGAHIASPLRLELQKGMERAAQEMSQTVKRVLGSEAAKLRSELDAVRKQKRAYKEQREMAEMIKEQQGAFAQRMSLEGLPQSLRDEMMAAMSRAATDLEDTVSKAMGSEAEKIAHIEQSFRSKQEEYVQVAELLGRQQAEYEQGMQQILGIGDQSVEGDVDPSPAKSRSHIEIWGLDVGVGEDDDDIEEIVLQKETVVDDRATERLGRSLGGANTQDVSMRTSDLFEISTEMETQTPLRSSPVVTVNQGAGHQEVRLPGDGPPASSTTGAVERPGLSSLNEEDVLGLEDGSYTGGASVTQAIGRPRLSSEGRMSSSSGDSTPNEPRSRLGSLCSPTWDFDGPQQTASQSQASSFVKAGSGVFARTPSSGAFARTPSSGAFARTPSSSNGSSYFARVGSSASEIVAAPSPILFGRPAFSKSMDKKLFTGNSVGTGALSHSDKARGSIPFEGDEVSKNAKLGESASATDLLPDQGNGDQRDGAGEDQKDEVPDVIPEILKDPKALDGGQETGEDGKMLKRVLSDGLGTGWANTLASQLSKQVESLKKGELPGKIQSFKRRGSKGNSFDARTGFGSGDVDRVSSSPTGDTELGERLPVIRTAEEVQSQLAKLGNVGITKSFIIREAADRKTAFPSVLDQLCSYNMTELRHQRDFGQTQQKRDLDKQALVERWKSTLAPRTLNVFSLDSPLRARAILLTENPWFERFVQATIVANIVWFCMGDPESTSGMNRGPHYVGFVIFEIIFLFEAVTKIVANGLWYHEQAYLKQRWNYLDAVCLVMGIIELIPAASFNNPATVMRVLRILRPSRAMRKTKLFTEIGMLVQLLIGCIPMLTNVFGLLVFIFFAFGILGVQVFQGFYRGRCFSIETGIISLDRIADICSLGEGMSPCPPGSACLPLWDNPMFDIVSFDNVGSSMIVIFQIMVQQEWSDIMYAAWDSFSFWTWPYFLFLNIVGPMFAIQLFLVVVANRYAEAKSRQNAVDEQAASSAIFEIKIGIVQGLSLPRILNVMGEQAIELDPYVVVTVDDRVRKTKVIRNSSSPEWNEYFRFPVSNVASRAKIELFNWQATGKHHMMACSTIAIGRSNEFDEGTDRYYEMTKSRGGAFEGVLRVRTQWRHAQHQGQEGLEEWSPLPDVEEDDDDIPNDDVADVEDSRITKLRAMLKAISHSTIFGFIVMCAIMISIIAMAIDSDCSFVLDPSCSILKRDLELCTLVMTCFFLAEAIIKVGGYGKRYFKDPSNVFDFSLVVLSLATFNESLSTHSCFSAAVKTGLVEDMEQCGTQGVSSLRAFRMLRVLRLVRLMKRFPSVQRQFIVISSTITAVSSLVCIMGVFLIVFSIVAMRIFGGKGIDSLDAQDADQVAFFRPGVYTRVLFPGVSEPKTARLLNYSVHHYDADGLLAPYEMQLQDQDTTFWLSYAQDVMPSNWHSFSLAIDGPVIVGIRPRNCLDSFVLAFLTVFQLLTTSDFGDAMYPALRGTNQVYFVFFVLLIVIGNFMIFNLFVAIIITGFVESKEQMLRQKRENDAMRQYDQVKKSTTLNQANSIARQSLGKSIQQGDRNWHDKIFKWIFVNVFRGQVALTGSELRAKAAISKLENKSADSTLTDREMEGISILLRIIKSRVYGNISFAMVIISCLNLAIQRPGQGAFELLVMTVINFVVNVFFVFDVIFRWYAMGLRLFFSSTWNVFDLFLALISFIDFIIETILLANPDGNDLASSSNLISLAKTLRALRPLTIVSRSKDMRQVLVSVSRSVVPVANTVVIMLSIFFLFGILSVELIGARTSYCSDPFILNMEDCQGLDSDGEIISWRQRSGKYDWIGAAMLSMFAVASQDNWQLYMYAAVDATGKKTGPYVDSHLEMALFFIIFMVIGSFFTVQLFVGVFIDTYQNVLIEVKMKGMRKLAMESEKTGLARQDSIGSDSSSATGGSAVGISEPSSSKWRLKLYDIMTNKQTEYVIGFFILLNLIFMSLESHQMSESISYVVEASDFFFMFIFVTEAIFRITAAFPNQYIRSRWNRFDYTIIVLNIFGTCINLTKEIDIDPRVVKIVRVFRVLRLSKVLRYIPGLKSLVRTLLKSLSSVAHLASLLFLLFFIFGILTVQIFGNLCLTNEDSVELIGSIDRCEFIMDRDLLDMHVSFSNLGMAMLTLFRVCTNDNWSDIMAITSLEPPLRPLGFGDTVSLARVEITRYLESGNQTALVESKKLLRGCQTEEELYALRDVISCRNMDEFGKCPSTCGTQSGSGIIFCGFLTMSNFVLLNLVMAVLIQELQKAIVREERSAQSEETQLSLQILTSVGNATKKWLNVDVTAIAGSRQQAYSETDSEISSILSSMPNSPAVGALGAFKNGTPQASPMVSGKNLPGTMSPMVGSKGKASPMVGSKARKGKGNASPMVGSKAHGGMSSPMWGSKGRKGSLSPAAKYGLSTVPSLDSLVLIEEDEELADGSLHGGQRKRPVLPKDASPPPDSDIDTPKLAALHNYPSASIDWSDNYTDEEYPDSLSRASSSGLHPASSDLRPMASTDNLWLGRRSSIDSGGRSRRSSLDFGRRSSLGRSQSGGHSTGRSGSSGAPSISRTGSGSTMVSSSGRSDLSAMSEEDSLDVYLIQSGDESDSSSELGSDSGDGTSTSADSDPDTHSTSQGRT